MNDQHWHQQPNESPKSYEAAHIYFEMGAKRSLAAVAKQVGKDPSLMKRWSSQHGWVARARVFDEACYRESAERSRQTMMAAAAAQALRWREKDEALRERQYQQSLEGLHQVDRMLDAPLFTTNTKTAKRRDGTTVETVTIRPTGWTLDTARRMARQFWNQNSDAIDDGRGRPRRSRMIRTK